MKEILMDLIQFINSNRKRFFGALFGFLIGILILTIGFFKTLFIVLTTLIGYLWGSKSFTKMDLVNFLEKILPPGKIK